MYTVELLRDDVVIKHCNAPDGYAIADLWSVEMFNLAMELDNQSTESYDLQLLVNGKVFMGTKRSPSC